MRTIARAGLLLLACGISGIASSQKMVHASLDDWQRWVMYGEEFRGCPFLSSAPADADEPMDEDAYRCVWPERLVLIVDAQGGSFTQRWQVFAESWVALPGDTEYWPREVRLNGAPAAIVEHDGPGLRLGPGSYTVSGRFEWSARPESLPVPFSTAIVDLTVDGQRVPQPERPDGAVWLGKRRSAEQAAAMEVQVYRLLRDDIPANLLTRIRVNVAGDAREELLARVLPEGFTPLSLTGPLPARLERDGTLRVQVRPGSHIVTLFARGSGVAGTLMRPDASGGKWAREEIWSFSSNDLLRIAAAEGADGIDSVQANVPADWLAFPAFRMDKDSKLSIVERSRGIANADDNRLSLTRNLWLDFDHGGFTAVDAITGTLRRDWRLNMQGPFALASARQADDQLLVTEGVAGASGVELRQPRLVLNTIARKTAGSAMPATGWDQRFDRVAGKLHLPPGHRLIAALGADGAPDSWWEQWALWNVFGVMLIVAFVYWAAGRMPAAIAAVALLLTYQEAPEHLWMWGNLLAALALARAVTAGKLGLLARAYRTVSFAILGLALLPFLIAQFRYALYPQLAPRILATDYSHMGSESPVENPYGLEALWVESPSLIDLLLPSRSRVSEPAYDAAIQAEIVEEVAIPTQAMAEAAFASPGPPSPEMSMGRPPVQVLPDLRIPKPQSLNAAQVIQRYAAGTVLQAGPGIPNWRYNSYGYFWDGPVEITDTVRFIYVGPTVMFFWRLIGAAALVVLFLWLAVLSFGGTGLAPGALRFTFGNAARVAPLLLVACGVALPGRAQAAGADLPEPNASLLAELKTRLTAAPACTPDCATISAARVAVDGNQLEVILQVSALACVAVPMPHASDRWQLDEVSVDGRSSLALGREQDASLWLPLTPGAHTVRLAGRLAAAESIQLAFPEPPRSIDVRASGWTVSGVNESRLVAGSLELARERGGGAGTALEAGSEFPTFVHVERTFNLDLDWTLLTEVTRIAPERAPVSLQIPLVNGESVLTPGVEVKDDLALVGLAAGELNTGWRSGLSRSETLELGLPANAARSEIWNFVVNPQWNVAFEGFPPILPDNVSAPMWVFRFVPRPGEKLALKITRPRAKSGTTLAIDHVLQEVTVGERSTRTRLTAVVRSTQGGRHVIRLPEDARVTGVMFDQRPQQLRPEKGELPLSLTPGKHSIVVTWERMEAASWRTQPPQLDLGTPASNIQYALRLPDSRWALAAWGPGIGPAVLYWAELALFIVIAWLLGRWSHSPLSFTEWLLLGLGLSTQSWVVFTLTAIWLLLVRWRESWQPGPDMVFRFNVVQVLLALFTLYVVTILLFSGVRDGLLESPDMGILDQRFGNGRLWWFADHTTGVVASPTVISAPMGLYRVLFFSWAGWLAFALVRWLRRAFNAWRSNGLWRTES